jgi:PAS domain S-box-containing protein
LIPVANPLPDSSALALLQALAAERGEWVVASDPQGRIVWADARFLAVTGWAEALGALLPPQIRPDAVGGAPDVQPVIERGLAEGVLSDTLVQMQAPGRSDPPLRLRLRITAAGGLRLWTMSVLAPEQTGDRPIDASAALRSTQRVDGGEASTQLGLAVELAGLSIWRHDLLSNRLHYNARGFEVLGLPYRPEGLMLDEVRALTHPDDVPAVIASAQHTLETGQPTTVPARYRRSDGSWRHAVMRRALQRDAGGQPVAFLGVAMDLTDQVVDQLRRAEESHRLNNATASAGVGVWSRDMLSDEAHWNSQMYRLCGRDAALGPPSLAVWVEEIIHPEDRAPMQAAWQTLSDAGDRVVEQEYRVRRADGELRWLVDLARLEHWNGRAMIFGATLDVTERRQAEAVQRDALAARRLGEIRSQLLARVSHELRTPLNAILGFTQLLEIDAGTPSPDDVQARQRLFRLGHIRQASEQLLTLVNEVLDLSRIEAGLFELKLVPVALDDVLAEVLASQGASMKAQQVQLDARMGGLVVDADRSRLVQVLDKLISHRLAQLPAGGAMSLQADAAGAEVRLVLTDDGHALTPAQQLQLFEPFGRLGNGAGNEPDTGLNLALVKALMACMGGRIDLDGSTRQGNRFVLTLAGAGSDGRLRLATSAAEPAARRTPGKVLYIEDNPVNVILVEELIAQRGDLSLCCEVTGAQGVARAQELHPDLVLIDMQLPDFDGFEVLRQLRAHPATAHSRCIALSANAMPDDVALALAAGFDDYWTKPIRFNRFLEGLDGIFPRPAAG